MRIYNHIRDRIASSLLREKIYRILKAPWIAKNSLYNLLYSKRIKEVMRKGKNFPRIISIETTNFCNARCIMCAYPFMKRKKGFMEEKLYKKIIDEVKEKEFDILLLSGFGEPLLDKRLPRFIQYAKDKGIKKIGIVTNASLLTKKNAKILEDGGLDELHISIDGATKEVYEKIRVGLSFEKVVENIENLKDLKKTRVFLKMVLIKENKGEVKKFIHRFKNVADKIVVRQAQDWVGTVEVHPEGYTPHVEAPKEYYPPCYYLWTSISIYWDGKVPLCCLDYDAKVILGNVYYSSIQQIWNGEKLLRIRELHIKGKRKAVPLCKECGYFSVWW